MTEITPMFKVLQDVMDEIPPPLPCMHDSDCEAFATEGFSWPGGTPGTYCAPHAQDLIAQCRAFYARVNAGMDRDVDENHCHHDSDCTEYVGNKVVWPNGLALAYCEPHAQELHSENQAFQDRVQAGRYRMTTDIDQSELALYDMAPELANPTTRKLLATVINLPAIRAFKEAHAQRTERFYAAEVSRRMGPTISLPQVA